jgi:hypothetical protein
VFVQAAILCAKRYFCATGCSAGTVYRRQAIELELEEGRRRRESTTSDNVLFKPILDVSEWKTYTFESRKRISSRASSFTSLSEVV